MTAVASGSVPAGEVWDTMVVAGVAQPHPEALNPTLENIGVTPNCGNATSMDHWQQNWFIGSTSPGAGVHVQRNTFHRYYGKAAHESVTSPPGGF